MNNYIVSTPISTLFSDACAEVILSICLNPRFSSLTWESLYIRGHRSTSPPLVQDICFSSFCTGTVIKPHAKFLFVSWFLLFVESFLIWNFEKTMRYVQKRSQKVPKTILKNPHFWGTFGDFCGFGDFWEYLKIQNNWDMIVMQTKVWLVFALM